MGVHSIIVIKNTKGQYLQYFDPKWNSYLFLNCKLPNGDDSNAVKSKVAGALNIEEQFIKVSLVGFKKHKKFSESSKVNKEYIHFFYNVDLDIKLCEDSIFIINGMNYKWFSYFDLIEDKQIQKVNSDIIQFIKDFHM